jgi:putative transposase
MFRPPDSERTNIAKDACSGDRPDPYIKVKGERKYLYRFVDKAGNTVDFLFDPRRDEATAQRYFEKTIAGNTDDRQDRVNLARFNVINLDYEITIKLDCLSI